VAVVDRTFAERYFPGESPIGKRVRATNDRTFREVVGVVGPVHQAALREAPEPHLYVAQVQNPSPVMTFVVRASVNPASLTNAVRDAVRRTDPLQPLFNVRTLEDVLAGSVASQRLNALLIALFAGLALLLSIVGVYGLISCWVASSIGEIGVRMALGADSRGIYSLVYRRGLRVTLAGVIIGICLAWATTRLLATMLYGVHALDPEVFLVSAAFVLLASAVATGLPARRALSINPASSLRS
jgi:predicted lysophospholipase L1 biosynthesis ABC-type transport system permease subunit